MLDVDEAQSLFASYRGNADLWVASHVGARDAVRFARVFRSLENNHPTTERPHKLRRLRCPDCKRLSLVWNPPEDQHDTITVTCQSEGCGKTIHEHEKTPEGANGRVEKIAVIADIETRTA